MGLGILLVKEANISQDKFCRLETRKIGMLGNRFTTTDGGGEIADLLQVH
jgi:hypothetical protein